MTPGAAQDVAVTDVREAAWWAVHAALALRPGWAVTPAAYHAEERPVPRWHVTAVDARRLGRRARHAALEGVGATEIEALEVLARLLEEGQG
jgi:hypothetical protein